MANPEWDNYDLVAIELREALKEWAQACAAYRAGVECNPHAIPIRDDRLRAAEDRLLAAINRNK